MQDGTLTAAVRRWPQVALAAAALALLVAAYANHFGNSFHFDDSHSIVDNIYIRDLRNIPHFFTDATTFSALPQNQTYRPLLLVTYALDVWLGRGLKASQFQLTSFLLFVAQCALMAVLFTRLLDLTRPDHRNRYLALFGATLYGVHAAVAETVNYVSARSDVLSTLFVVLALTLYVRFPGARRWGLYLAALLLGGLVKPVVVVFPLLVFSYRVLFRDDDRPPGWSDWRRAILAAVPSLVMAVGIAALHARMTPAGFDPGGPPRFNYVVTQPYVALRYFARFVAPIGLSADTDLGPLTSASDPRALIGFGYVAVLGLAIWYLARRAATRSVAFGLLWFVIALLPTSLFPLAEVENDHRMFFPFVGLALATAAAAGLALARWAGPRRSLWRWATAAGMLVLAAHAVATHERNRVWRDEESLWRDTTLKSPNNGRAWMNYGLTKMYKGELDGALACFERAKTLVPGYSYLYVNLGITLEAKGRPAEAETDFLTAIRLARRTAEPYFYYARFLHDQRRPAEALVYVQKAIEMSPAHLDARHLLLNLLAESRDAAALRQAAEATLALWPQDDVARRAMQTSASGTAGRPAPPPGPGAKTPEAWITESLALFRVGRFEDSIAACRAALRVRPDYPEAYNNICAAYNSLQRWDLAVGACEQALRLRPDFELARNNLRWAQSQGGAVKR